MVLGVEWVRQVGWEQQRSKVLSRVPLFATPGTAVPQTPLFMGFSRQEYWSGLPLPPLGDIPYLEIKPTSPELQAVFYH